MQIKGSVFGAMIFAGSLVLPAWLWGFAEPLGKEAESDAKFSNPVKEERFVPIDERKDSSPSRSSIEDAGDSEALSSSPARTHAKEKELRVETVGPVETLWLLRSVHADLSQDDRELLLRNLAAARCLDANLAPDASTESILLRDDRLLRLARVWDSVETDKRRLEEEMDKRWPRSRFDPRNPQLYFDFLQSGESRHLNEYRGRELLAILWPWLQAMREEVSPAAVERFFEREQCSLLYAAVPGERLDWNEAEKRLALGLGAP